LKNANRAGGNRHGSQLGEIRTMNILRQLEQALLRWVTPKRAKSEWCSRYECPHMVLETRFTDDDGKIYCSALCVPAVIRLDRRANRAGL